MRHPTHCPPCARFLLAHRPVALLVGVGRRKRKHLRLCVESASRQLRRALAQESGNVQETSDSLLKSSEVLERVVLDIENLISESGSQFSPSQRSVQLRLSQCLEELHAKLEEGRGLMQSTEGEEKEKKLSALDSELTDIKMEVMELKQQLMTSEQSSESTLQSCMQELDSISLTDKECFLGEEKEAIDQLYTEFREVMRTGEDGALELVQLIYAFQTIKEKKTPKEIAIVESIEREALTHVVDIYSSLFPSSQQEESAPVASPGFLSDSTNIGTVPKSVPDEQEVSRTGGGGGGGSDDDGDDGDDSDSDGDDGGADGIGWSFLIVCGILLLCLSAVIFLPEDKTKLKERIRWREAKAWLQKITGTAPPPSVPEKKGKNNRRP